MLALSGALSIMSCRHVELDVPVSEGNQGIGQFPVDGKVNVQVNLLGTSFSSQGGAYGLSDSKAQTLVRELSPGNTIVAELTPTVSPFSSIVKGENLPKDYPYRVFVFNQEDRTLVDYKDFRVGEEKPGSFTLDFEGNYILVAYTDSSGKLPEFEVSVPDEPDNKNKENPTPNQEKTLEDINIDFSGSDVMYFKMENYSPSKIGNIVNITLMHKTSGLLLDARQVLYGDHIKEVTVTPNYMSGSIDLSTGNITKRRESTEYKIEELSYNGPEGNVVSNLVAINSTDTIVFKAKIWRNNEFKDIELPLKLDLGTKYTLKLKMKYNCGAYVSKELWKEFMCHNLGANYKAHPMNTIKELYGNKYAWGVKEPVSTNEDDVKGISKPFPVHSPAVTAWQDDFKTENDPSPNRYRIPRLSDLEGLIEYNSFSSLKTWTEGKDYIVKFGNDLILPLAGLRRNNGEHRATEYGYYWPSYSEGKGIYPRLGFGLDVVNIEYPLDDTYAISIRCIKEDGKVTVRPEVPKVGTGWDKEKDIEVDIDEIMKKKKEKKK